MIDINEKKRKIIEFLERQGPSLPVQIAKVIQMEPVFASAILSELLNAKTIITSNMKIGASPLYLLPNQKEKLEEKSENLKPIEKEAQEKLKSKKILTDENEEPATRIALRNIKDFAIPFKFKEKIMWKYAFAPQEEIEKILFSEEEKENSPKTNNSKPEEENKKEESPKPKNLKHEEKKEEDIPKGWEMKKNTPTQSEPKQNEQSKKTNETKKIENIFTEEKKTPKTFLEEIEEFLSKKNTKINTIEEVDKKKVIAIIKSKEKESMLFAFNKMKINETELLKCYKIADKKNLPYQIITRGNLTKKLLETIRAYQRLLKTENLEN